MSSVLILGGSGFVGTHLNTLLKNTYDVVSAGDEFDIRDLNSIKTLVAKVQPDKVVNLAAVSTLKESFQNPYSTYDINFIGTLNILTALRDIDFHGRFLFVSSSEVYGLLVDDDLPVSESHRLRPLNPYAVSKAASEMLCYQWSQTESFEIVVARPFNHIGPGQSERFALADFGRQIAAIKLGLSNPVLHVGDIDTTRDFTDVRDIVRAYYLLLELGQNGEVYNICSGVERSVRSLLMSMCELTNLQIKVTQQPERIRKIEQRRFCGNNSKLVKLTGWNQLFTIEQTLSDIIDYWEIRLDV